MMNEKQGAVDCRGAMDKLFDLLDGEVTPEVERRIRAHITGCKHCYSAADFEQRFLDAVHAARTDLGPGAAGAASAKLRERVLEALRSEGLPGGQTTP